MNQCIALPDITIIIAIIIAILIDFATVISTAITFWVGGISTEQLGELGTDGSKDE